MLRPSLGRVLPELLPAVDGAVEQSVRRCHRLVAAAGGPVGLVDLVAVAEVAGQDAEVPVGEQRDHGFLRHRVPGSRVAHEVAVARALLVRALAEDRVADVPRVQIAQLVDVARVEGAALALLRRGLAGMPHVEVGDQLGPALEDVDQRHRPVGTDQLRGRIELDHGQPAPLRGQCITGAGVGLLLDAEFVDPRLPRRPVGHLRHRMIARRDLCHALDCC